MTKSYKTMAQLKDSQLLYDTNPPAFGGALIVIMHVALIGALIWSVYTPRTYVVKSNGTIISETRNYIMSSYTGEITQAFASEGDYVVQGDVLFQISSTDLDLQAE